MYTKETSKLYTGTKIIRAWPMTRAEYNAYRGWTIPADENPEDTGYLVEYTDGIGKPNCPNPEGYISWSPSDVFGASYVEIQGGTEHQTHDGGVDIAQAGNAPYGYDLIDGTYVPRTEPLPEPEFKTYEGADTLALHADTLPVETDEQDPPAA